MRVKLLPFLFLLPILALIFSLGIYPLFFSLYYSFFQYTIHDITRISFVGVSNYIRIPFDNLFQNSFSLSILYTAFCLALEFPLGLGFAILFNSERKVITAIRSIIIVPMILTPVAVGVIWKMMFQSEFGIINYIIGKIGLPPQPWLGDPSLAMVAVVVVDVWQWTPFIFLILLASLQGLPKEPLEAARIDGASSFQLFRHIILPMIKLPIIVALLLRTIDLLRIFDHIYIVTRGGPALATDFLSLFIYRTGLKFFDIGYASALSWIYLFILTFIAIITFKIAKIKI